VFGGRGAEQTSDAEGEIGLARAPAGFGQGEMRTRKMAKARQLSCPRPPPPGWTGTSQNPCLLTRIPFC